MQVQRSAGVSYQFEGARCVGLKWWPWPGEPTDRPEAWERALVTCAGCPCRAPCAEMALSFGTAVEGMSAGVRLSRELGGRRMRELLGPVMVEVGVDGQRAQCGGTRRSRGRRRSGTRQNQGRRQIGRSSHGRSVCAPSVPVRAECAHEGVTPDDAAIVAQRLRSRPVSHLREKAGMDRKWKRELRSGLGVKTHKCNDTREAGARKRS